MAIKIKFYIFDSDRKTCDLLSAFLTYKGYATTVFSTFSDIFDTETGIQRIMIAERNALLAISNDIYEQIWNFDPYLVIILYGEESHTARIHCDERLVFIQTPLNLDELDNVVIRAIEHQTMNIASPEQLIENYPGFLSSTIIGKSKKIRSLFDMIEKVAISSATVLIQGESGTGKELAAQAIHQLSDRNSKNFVPVNCAAIPDDLLESELFGHVKGSFTGAYSNRIGRFELADKGTLFLDEIGDMKASLQVKLLRVLQAKEFEPVGSTRSQKVDVRIIAATNKNLEEQVARGAFREDLYYRLSVIPITIPPLRERRDDIPVLIHHFQEQFSRNKKCLINGFSKEALDMLCCYDWPGNVRELENLVERMITIKGCGLVTVDDLPEKYIAGRNTVSAPKRFKGIETTEIPSGGICFNSAVDEFENSLIMKALQLTNGNKKEAAELLNLKRTTLIEKLKKKNIRYS